MTTEPEPREGFTVPPDGRAMAEQPAWRRDFPIDWPEDHHVARRDFTRFLGLTSLAFAAGQVWIGIQSAYRRLRGAPGRKWIADRGGIPPGGAVEFAYPGEHDPCLLVRLDADRFVAYSQKCTHLSCAVVPRPSASVLHCPCHEGSFDLATGRPLAGPPRRPLDHIRLVVEGERIYAAGVERSTL